MPMSMMKMTLIDNDDDDYDDNKEQQVHQMTL